MSLRPLPVLAGVFLSLVPFLVLAQSAGKPTPRYVTSEGCVTCHQDQSDAWRNSHHALAWLQPSDEAVLGDFEGGSFEKDGEVTRFSKADNDYFVDVEDRDGITSRYAVAGTAGVAPLQQYLLETEPGRLQALDVAWDAVERRWYHLYPGAELAPDDGLHWTGPYKNWNARCAECHATGFEKNYDARTRTYASTQSETGVGCEACHGPGEAHRAWAEAPSTFDPELWSGVDSRGFAHTFSAEDAEAEIQQCAGCHARREPLTDASTLPGTSFHDAYKLALLRPGLYHADGQILDEVYVYGSFLQSRMYSEGVRCSNCHDPHSGALKAEGNAVCTQCHGPAGNPNFPSLAPKTYDTPDHHFHEAASPGAQCRNCHMIERTYMGIDGRRDHSFRIPRPDLSVNLGTPNACNDCHDDRSAEWAAETVATWFPNSASRQEPIASALAAAWTGEATPQTLSALIEAAADRRLPAFTRASALETLRRYGSAEIAERTHGFLTDPEPLVRTAAIPLQQLAPPTLRLQRVLPLLKDPRKVVRIEALRGLLDLLAREPALQVDTAVQSAFVEYQLSLLAKADFPETQMAMAGTALTFRRFGDAERAFAEAVRLDPQMVDAWIMIARLRAAQGDSAGAGAVLGRGLALNPGSPPLMQLLNDLGGAGAGQPR